MEQILQYKNPKDIIQLANNNNCLNDNNSYLWNNLLIKYYYNFIKYKNKNISIKDFYVLLYYSEILGLINFIPILDRAQHTLSLLPKIYDGDIIAILHACSTTSILGNHANIVMYRDKAGTIPHIYGKGNLRIKYLNIDKDSYLNKSIIKNIPTADKVEPNYGFMLL